MEPLGWRALKLLRVEAHGEEAVEFNFDVDHRTKGWECGVGLRMTGDWLLEPRLLSDVVLLLVPPHRVSLAEWCFFRRKPSLGTWDCLYQSGTVSFCNERCTLSWCSDITLSPFCSSFSGGWNKKRLFIYEHFTLHPMNTNKSK